MVLAVDRVEKHLFSSKKSDDDSVIVSIINAPSPEEVERAENFQITVAIAVITAFFTTSAGSDTVFSNAEQALGVLSIISILYLGVKLFLIVSRPFYSHLFLDAIDYIVIPFLFAITLSSAVGVILANIIAIPSVQNTTILGIIFKKAHSLTDNTTTKVIYLLLTFVLGIGYAWNLGKMSILQSRVPEIEFTFPSGNSGDDLPITIKNPTDSIIRSDKIQISVSSTEGVDAKITDGKKLSEGVYEPRLPIQPNSRIQLNLNISRSDKKEEIDNEEVRILVESENRFQKKHKINLYG